MFETHPHTENEVFRLIYLHALRLFLTLHDTVL
jgi:hypothetical protein